MGQKASAALAQPQALLPRPPTRPRAKASRYFSTVESRRRVALGGKKEEARDLLRARKRARHAPPESALQIADGMPAACGHLGRETLDSCRTDPKRGGRHPRSPGRSSSEDSRTSGLSRASAACRGSAVERKSIVFAGDGRSAPGRRAGWRPAAPARKACRRTRVVGRGSVVLVDDGHDAPSRAALTASARVMVVAARRTWSKNVSSNWRWPRR